MVLPMRNNHANNAHRRLPAPVEGNPNESSQRPALRPYGAQQVHQIPSHPRPQQPAHPMPANAGNAGIRMPRAQSRQVLHELDENPRVLKQRIPRRPPESPAISGTMEADDDLDFGGDDSDAIDLSSMFNDTDDDNVPKYAETSQSPEHDDTVENIDDIPDDELFNEPEPPMPAMHANANTAAPSVPVVAIAAAAPHDEQPIAAAKIADVTADVDKAAPVAAAGNSLLDSLKSKANDFIAKVKSEIGAPDDETDEDNDKPDDEDANRKDETEENRDSSDKSADDENDNPDDKNNDEDKPSVDNNGSIVDKIISILTFPFRLFLWLLRTASSMIRILLSLGSLFTVLLLLWSLFNIPAAFNKSIPSFDSDEGTLTAENVAYNDGMLTFSAKNTSDMIAHAGITGEVKAWKPFHNLPASILAPVKVQSCESVYVDINPGDSKEITLKCSGDTGVWMRPQVHITGE